MKLIVGLGNPGRQYEGTRHNLGFRVVAALVARHGAAAPRARFRGETSEVSLAGQQCLLLCPSTFMNLSGASVQEAMAFYKLPLEALLVVCDDLNLPLGKLRFRTAGSAGGQRGLEDIIRRLGTQEFARLRIGIDPPPAGWNWADYVLSRFRSDEVDTIDAAVDRAAGAVAEWVGDGTATCMNRYN